MEDPSPTFEYGKPPRIKAGFNVCGRDFDPDLVTEGLGLQPTSIWAQSLPHLRAMLELDTDCWSLEIVDTDSRSVSSAVEQLLERVLPVAMRLPEVLRLTGASAGVTVIVTIEEDRPVYDLSPRAIAGLAALNCEFGMDIYDYSDPSPPDDES